MPENAGTVSICVNGGKEVLPVIMEVLNTSTASEETENQDFEVVDVSQQEIGPGDTYCFDIRILDDTLNENSEVIRLLFRQGNGTNATFELIGEITIVDNDFSEH